MGLIDSTNRIERAILSDKQAKRLEREERKRERKQKERDRLDLSISKELMQEGLYNEFSGLYNQLGYNGASLYLKSLDARQRILNKICNNELEYKMASGLYDKVLSSIDKIYKHNEEYLANLPPSQSERQKQARHDMAQALAGVILAFIKVVGRALTLVVLVFIGFDKLASGVCKKKKRYR